MIRSVPLSLNLVNRILPWVTLVAILDDEGGAIRPPSQKVEEKHCIMKVAQWDLNHILDQPRGIKTYLRESKCEKVVHEKFVF